MGEFGQRTQDLMGLACNPRFPSPLPAQNMAQVWSSFSSSLKSSPIVWPFGENPAESPVTAACHEHAIQASRLCWNPPSWSVAPMYSPEPLLVHHQPEPLPVHRRKISNKRQAENLHQKHVKMARRSRSPSAHLRAHRQSCQHWIKRKAQACSELVQWFRKATHKITSQRKQLSLTAADLRSSSVCHVTLEQASIPTQADVRSVISKLPSQLDPIVHQQVLFLWNQVRAWQNHVATTQAKESKDATKSKGVRFCDQITVHNVDRLCAVEIVGEVREPNGSDPNWASIGQGRARRLMQFAEQLECDQLEALIGQWRELSQESGQEESGDECCFDWQNQCLASTNWEADDSWGSDEDDSSWGSDEDEDQQEQDDDDCVVWLR